MRPAIEHKFYIFYFVENFVYYFANYAMVVLTSRTSGNKILYTRYYKAEIGVTILELVTCAYEIYGTVCFTTLV